MTSHPWSALRVDGARLLQRLHDLGQCGALEGGGTNRLALSDADKAARDWTVQQMRDHVGGDPHQKHRQNLQMLEFLKGYHPCQICELLFPLL